MSEQHNPNGHRPEKRKSLISIGFRVFLVVVFAVAAYFLSKSVGNPAYEAQNQSLTEEVKELKEQLNAYSGEAASGDKQLQTLTEQNEKLQQANESLQKEIDALKKGGSASTDSSSAANTDQSSAVSTATSAETGNESNPAESVAAATDNTQHRGKNHNEAANSYAYKVEDVRAASNGGDQLKGKKLAFLTFDDGISIKSTPLLLNELDKLGVPATHFIVGDTLGTHAAPILQRIYNDGHAIAMHSYDHEYKELYPNRSANADEILKQAKQTLQAMRDIMGDDFDTNVWRYPGGHMSWKSLDAADTELDKLHIEWIDWSAVSGDAEPKSRRPTTVEGLVQFTEKTIKQSPNPDVVVILMHDGTSKKLTRDALPEIVKYLKSEGYSFGVLE